MTTTIALDAMGGDFGPSVVIPAALEAVRQYSDLKLLLVGRREVLLAELHRLGASESTQISLVHAEQSVAMDETAAQALRGKRQSSMRIALNLVKEGQADACVSAGNTGALMAIARAVLKTIPGIDRPAIITQLPAAEGSTHVLDLGANVYCNEDHLVQFAIMGSVLAQAQCQQRSPKVGLLNIGEEEIKGNEQVKQAALKLSDMPQLNYIGFVEGNDIYSGKVDVVVCDGFVGNIALKTSEGLIRMIFSTIRSAFANRWWGKLAGFLVKPIMADVKDRLDPRHYNGATLIGLRKPVIKSHGSADVFAYTQAIRSAVEQVNSNVPEKVRDQIATLMQEFE